MAQLAYAVFEEVSRFREGPHFSVIAGGFEAFKTALLLLDRKLQAPSTKYLTARRWNVSDNHPNYYVQILAETGVVGLTAAGVFLGSLIYNAYKRCQIVSRNPILCPLWIVPLALFWPLSTHADFFGQWINVFAWTGIGVSIGTIYSNVATKTTLP